VNAPLALAEVRAAAERSLTCLDCGVALAVVCRLPVGIVAGGAAIGPFCLACAEGRSPGRAWSAAVPCQHCERGVRNHRQRGRHTFCCEACFRELRLADRRRERETSTRRCPSCNEPFKPRRKDQKTHNGACRTALYRAKQRAKDRPFLAPVCTCGGASYRDDDGGIACVRCGKWKTPPHSRFSDELYTLLGRERTRAAGWASAAA
jgi:hypothetical protein